MSAARGEHEVLFSGRLVDGLPSIVTAAHELKSPLALIRQLALMAESGNLTESDQQRILRQISLTSERSLRLTSDLTRSAKLSDGLFELEPINPYQLCEDILHELTPLFAAYDCQLQLKSRKHRLLTIANRDLLRRVIINFADNALHYADPNMITEIKIGSINGGQTVRLGVRDYGPAVSKDIFNSLNNRLSKRAASSIHARPQSSGLGLFISSQFAEKMNGQVGVTRHRDGSTFYIDLQASRQLSLL